MDPRRETIPDRMHILVDAAMQQARYEERRTSDGDVSLNRPARGSEELTSSTTAAVSTRNNGFSDSVDTILHFLASASSPSADDRNRLQQLRKALDDTLGSRVTVTVTDGAVATATMNTGVDGDAGHPIEVHSNESEAADSPRQHCQDFPKNLQALDQNPSLSSHSRHRHLASDSVSVSNSSTTAVEMADLLRRPHDMNPGVCNTLHLIPRHLLEDFSCRSARPYHMYPELPPQPALEYEGQHHQYESTPYPPLQGLFLTDWDPVGCFWRGLRLDVRKLDGGIMSLWAWPGSTLKPRNPADKNAMKIGNDGDAYHPAAAQAAAMTSALEAVIRLRQETRARNTAEFLAKAGRDPKTYKPNMDPSTGLHINEFSNFRAIKDCLDSFMEKREPGPSTTPQHSYASTETGSRPVKQRRLKYNRPILPSQLAPRMPPPTLAPASYDSGSQPDIPWYDRRYYGDRHGTYTRDLFNHVAMNPTLPGHGYGYGMDMTQFRMQPSVVTPDPPMAPMTTLPASPMTTLPAAPMTTLPASPMTTLPAAPMTTVPAVPTTTLPAAPITTLSAASKTTLPPAPIATPSSVPGALASTIASNDSVETPVINPAWPPGTWEARAELIEMGASPRDVDRVIEETYEDTVTINPALTPDPVDDLGHKVEDTDMES